MSSLKELTIRGSGWIFAGYGASQAFRLGSNLILTRLLIPKVFGLSALINTFMTGLRMFSDLGIGLSILQSDRGDDPVFLNNAWTIQVFRGLFLWICACIGAWPFARFYGEPELGWLITISGITVMVSGFNSTSLFTAQRHLRMARLTLTEIFSQLLAIGVMISWAVISPTVWALVAGGLAGSLVKMAASHIWLPGIKHRFSWDHESVQSLVRFGRWIFLSTLISFILDNSDRLILGKVLSLSDLGVYSIAAMIAKVIQIAYSRLAMSVLLPVYSKLKRLSREEFRARIRRVRMAKMGVFLPPLWILAIFGQDIISFLYDDRYHEAGWMLQILAVGGVFRIGSTTGPFYLAFGNSFLNMVLVAVQGSILLGGMAVGGIMYGKIGVIVGIGACQLIYYPIRVFVYRKHSVWLYGMDAVGLGGSLGVILFGLWATGQMQLPGFISFGGWNS
jgi:O-antigen/teichoic acid export membrane protein